MTVDDVTIDVLADDPHPVLAELRATAPVVWVPALGGWVVTRRDLAVAVLRDDDTFTVDDPRFTTSLVVGPSMLSTDGVEHDRHRLPFGGEFRPASARGETEERVRALAAHLVDELRSYDVVDLRAGLAAPLAVRTIIEVLGLDADAGEVLGWYREIVRSVTELSAGRPATRAGARAYVALAERISVGGDGAMFDRVAESSALTRAEIASNIAVIMFGAIETSEGAIANLFHHLLSSPGAFGAVAGDRSLVSVAVEESLRLEPAATQVDRYATADVVVGDAHIAAGDYVVVSLAAANRDPDVFDHPDRFDLGRTNATQHLSFVQGPHACLGIHLARLEMRAALGALLDATASVVAVAPIPSPAGLVFRKPESVPARCIWHVESEL